MRIFPPPLVQGHAGGGTHCPESMLLRRYGHDGTGRVKFNTPFYVGVKMPIPLVVSRSKEYLSCMQVGRVWVVCKEIIHVQDNQCAIHPSPDALECILGGEGVGKAGESQCGVLGKGSEDSWMVLHKVPAGGLC